LNPIATNLVRHIHFGGFGCTEDLKNLIKEKCSRIEKEEEELQTFLTNAQENLATEKKEKSTQTAEQNTQTQASIIDESLYKKLKEGN